jgi:hypothetical protein
MSVFGFGAAGRAGKAWALLEAPGRPTGVRDAERLGVGDRREGDGVVLVAAAAAVPHILPPAFCLPAPALPAVRLRGGNNSVALLLPALRCDPSELRWATKEREDGPVEDLRRSTRLPLPPIEDAVIGVVPLGPGSDG